MVYNIRKIVKEYYEKSKEEGNIEMMGKYYNKIKELNELKDIKIKNNKINSYNKEISLLKEKQKFLYDDFINNYNNKKVVLDFKYKCKIDQEKSDNKKEIQIEEKNTNINRNKNLKNKKILILEKKYKTFTKLNLYQKALDTKNEIKKEKDLLIKKKLKEEIINKNLKINNINLIQKKKMDKILMNYEKGKIDLEIKYQKEKNILLNKFKNQISSFKLFFDKNKNNERAKYLYNDNYKDNLNNSFDVKILNNKIEDDETNSSFII